MRSIWVSDKVSNVNLLRVTFKKRDTAPSRGDGARLSGDIISNLSICTDLFVVQEFNNPSAFTKSMGS